MHFFPDFSIYDFLGLLKVIFYFFVLPEFHQFSVVFLGANLWAVSDINAVFAMTLTNNPHNTFYIRNTKVFGLNELVS